MSKQVEGRGALSPVVVFVGLVALVAAITAGVLLTREPAPPPTSEPGSGASARPTPNQTLTDEEAIARFKELDALRIEALEERDLKRLSTGIDPDGPMYSRLRKSIRNLLRQGVMVDEQWQLRRVAVVQNDQEQVQLRVVAKSDAKFFDASGNEVTQTAIAERRALKCVLRYQDASWLLHDCVITKAVPLESK